MSMHLIFNASKVHPGQMLPCKCQYRSFSMKLPLAYILLTLEDIYHVIHILFTSLFAITVVIVYFSTHAATVIFNYSGNMTGPDHAGVVIRAQLLGCISCSGKLVGIKSKSTANYTSSISLNINSDTVDYNDGMLGVNEAEPAMESGCETRGYYQFILGQNRRVRLSKGF